MDITLNAESNTVELRADSATADCANLDYLVIGQEIDEESSNAAHYPAGDAELANGAVMAMGNGGYTGEGYIEGWYNDADPSAMFKVSTHLPGTYDIRVRYAAGHKDCENMELYLNGAKSSDLYFPITGSWTNWSSITQQVDLVKGLNTVEFRAAYASVDCANFDWVEVDAVDVYAALVAPYMLVDHSSILLGWNPGNGFDSVQWTGNLTNDFSLIHSNAFDGAFTDDLHEHDAAGFYQISSETLP